VAEEKKDIKGIVSVISIDIPCKDGNALNQCLDFFFISLWIPCLEEVMERNSPK